MRLGLQKLIAGIKLKKKKTPPWSSVYSREEIENNNLHLLVALLEVNQLAQGYAATKWQQEAEPRSVSLAPSAKHGIMKLQREFVKTQTYAWAQEEEMPCGFEEIEDYFPCTHLGVRSVCLAHGWKLVPGMDWKM